VASRHRPRVRALVLAVVASIAVSACDSQTSPSQASPSAGPSGPVPTTAATPIAGLTNVVLEATTGVTGNVPRSGGSVSATAANGTKYTLDIPSGALAADTQISMFPVSDVTNLPAGAEITAAVHLAPEGLQLAVPANLTIDLPTGSATTGLAGFGYVGDAQDGHLAPISVDGTAVTLDVRHFSGYGAGTTLGDIVGDDEGRGVFLQAYYDAIGTDRIATVLDDWYRALVQPKLAACADVLSFGPGQPCDLATYSMAEYLWDYYQWLRAAHFAIGIDTTSNVAVSGRIKALMEGARNAAAKQLLSYFDALNLKCNAVSAGPANADDPAGPLYWAGLGVLVNSWARDLELDTVFPIFKLESILDQLCVQVVIDPSRSYSGAKPDDEGILHVPTGVTIQDASGKAGPVRHDIPLQVKANWTAASSIGNPDSEGNYDVTFTWPQSQDPLVIDILASINSSNPNVNLIARFDRITKHSKNLKWDFENGSFGGWTKGVAGAQGAANWGKVKIKEHDGDHFVELDGTGGTGKPNSWIKQAIEIPEAATTLIFDYSAHDVAGANAALKVRIVSDGSSTTLFSVIASQASDSYDWQTKSLDISRWAGKTVTIYFEQNDNGPGQHEQIVLDNIEIV
jgi:hypothetical protein